MKVLVDLSESNYYKLLEIKSFNGLSNTEIFNSYIQNFDFFLIPPENWYRVRSLKKK